MFGADVAGIWERQPLENELIRDIGERVSMAETMAGGFDTASYNGLMCSDCTRS